MNTATPAPPIAHRGTENQLLRLLKSLGLVVTWIVALRCIAWNLGALHYDFPI